MIKRGRKKGSKNKYSGEPHNLIFWKVTLVNPNAMYQFLTRGGDRVKNEIKEIVSYLKRYQPEFFEKVNGDEILKEIDNGL